MTLQTYTKVIENFIGDTHAMSLLHTFYTDLPESEKPIFVTALIGHATISHQLLNKSKAIQGARR